MRNPWTKKNPFMSMWLSGANRVTAASRGQATAAAKKQTAALTRQTARLWTDAWLGTTRPKPKR